MSLGPQTFTSDPDNLINGGFPTVGKSIEIAASQTIKRGTIVSRSAAKFSVAVTNGTGGTVRISALGKTSSALPYDETLANVKTALTAMFGATGYTATGGALNASPIVITFAGELVGAEVVMTVDGSALTGAGTEKVEVTEDAGSQKVTKLTAVPVAGAPLYVAAEAATTGAAETATITGYSTGQFNARSIDCDSVVLAGIGEQLRSKGIHLSESIAAA